MKAASVGVLHSTRFSLTSNFDKIHYILSKMFLSRGLVPFQNGNFTTTKDFVRSLPVFHLTVSQFLRNSPQQLKCQQTCMWPDYCAAVGSLGCRLFKTYDTCFINPLNPELNPICYLLALLGAHHFLHVSSIRVKLLTFKRLMSYIYGALILDVSRSHKTTQHSR